MTTKTTQIFQKKTPSPTVTKIHSMFFDRKTIQPCVATLAAFTNDDPTKRAESAQRQKAALE
jgi:hypothetical protein